MLKTTVSGLDYFIIQQIAWLTSFNTEIHTWANNKLALRILFHMQPYQSVARKFNSSTKMFQSFLIVISALVVLNANGYQYINCDKGSEKNDIYINGNAWFACDIKKEEHFRYCIIRNDSNFSGKYISRDTLVKFAGANKPTNNRELENLCNDLTSRHSSQDIENQIDGEYDIYQGNFCVGSKGKVRRYINEQVLMKDCNRADMLYGWN